MARPFDDFAGKKVHVRTHDAGELALAPSCAEELEQESLGAGRPLHRIAFDDALEKGAVAFEILGDELEPVDDVHAHARMLQVLCHGAHRLEARAYESAAVHDGALEALDVACRVAGDHRVVGPRKQVKW
jgi:hypothetical protein